MLCTQRLSSIIALGLNRAQLNNHHFETSTNSAVSEEAATYDETQLCGMSANILNSPWSNFRKNLGAVPCALAINSLMPRCTDATSLNPAFCSFGALGCELSMSEPQLSLEMRFWRRCSCTVMHRASSASSDRHSKETDWR